MCNEYELAMILNKTGWTQAELIDAVDALVLTLGSKGSVIYTEGVEIPHCDCASPAHRRPDGRRRRISWRVLCGEDGGAAVGGMRTRGFVVQRVCAGEHGHDGAPFYGDRVLDAL